MYPVHTSDTHWIFVLMKKITSKGYGSRGMARGFSLIELLVVVAILALLVGLGVGVLGGSSSSRGIDQAGNTVSGLAQLARQHASSMNALTALVVAQTREANEDRMIVSIWDFDSSLKANQVERWSMLPSTISLSTVNDSLPGTLSPSGITYKNAAVTSPKYFWFYPDGRVGDGNSVPTLKLEPSKGSKENTYELVFNPVVGTHKINRP